MLNQALTMRNDWFTLRLLRELHYKSRSWEDLVSDKYVATRRRGSAGAVQSRAGEDQRVGAERDSEGAKIAYREALDADPSFLDGFLALARVARGTKDTEGLADPMSARLAEQMGQTRHSGLRVRRERPSPPTPPSGPSACTATPCRRRTPTPPPYTREGAQAHFLATEQTAAFLDALTKEAELLEGTSKAGVLAGIRDGRRR